MGPPIEELTVDGYDLQFGANVMGMLGVLVHCLCDNNAYLSRALAIHRDSHASATHGVNELDRQTTGCHDCIQCCLPPQLFAV
jgi:hypothetical protein